MAAKTKTASTTTKAPVFPAELVLRLHHPGMTQMHRAGLGGLAASLKALERDVKNLTPDKIPAHPWPDDKPPWTIEPHQITLRLGGTDETAREFLKRLFAFSFQIKEGLIHFPGTVQSELPLPVRAYLQEGLTLTFLQHGKSRTLSKEPISYHFEINDVPLSIKYKACTSYLHQAGWEDIDPRKPLKVAGPLNPGAVVRHVAFSGPTVVIESWDTGLALLFAIVGCLSLPIRHRDGVLIIPEVNHLQNFALLRPYLTPANVGQCLVAGASDAALQAEVRLRSSAMATTLGNVDCHAVLFSQVAWSTQQKSRKYTVTADADDAGALEIFEIALNCLSPRLRLPKPDMEENKPSKTPVQKGKGTAEGYWIDSVIRPLIADNLAQGNPWYAGFTRLMTAQDGKQPLRKAVSFEKDQLHQFIQTMKTITPESEQAEISLVEAVHAAMRQRYGKIADENSSNSNARNKRFEGEYERWRLGFSGAKTADSFRNSLCDLFSRAGRTDILQDKWRAILPLLTNDRWQLCRDLSLLALASYKGRVAESSEPNAKS